MTNKPAGIPARIAESSEVHPALIVGGALLVWLLVGVTLTLFIFGPR